MDVAALPPIRPLPDCATDEGGRYVLAAFVRAGPAGRRCSLEQRREFIETRNQLTVNLDYTRRQYRPLRRPSRPAGTRPSARRSTRPLSLPSRQHAAKRLHALADALAEGSDVRVTLLRLHGLATDLLRRELAL